MTVSSYLPDVAGGTAVAGSFGDEAAANAALELLASSSVRPQDISVVARDAALAKRLAGQRAWTPRRNRKGLMRLVPDPLPRTLRDLFGAALRDGRIVIVVAADGQPPDTVVALLQQAKADRVSQWSQGPSSLFAPPELAGPF